MFYHGFKIEENAVFGNGGAEGAEAQSGEKAHAEPIRVKVLPETID